ncbi:MAG: YitT family protein [Pseudomonadota bacterium]
MTSKDARMDPREQTPVANHTVADDAVGLASGVLLTTLGTHILIHEGLITGQTAGLALVISYASNWPFGLVFFLINLPFYGLAMVRMGWRFTWRTLACVAALSAAVPWAPDVLPIGNAHPLVCAVVASTAVGVGLLILFRHHASLGGIGILALYIQDKTGLQAGWFQMAIDAAIFAVALYVISPELLAVSFAGVAILNVILALNHRRDRYIAR